MQTRQSFVQMVFETNTHILDRSELDKLGTTTISLINIDRSADLLSMNHNVRQIQSKQCTITSRKTRRCVK
eukprot:m.199427 g.199427  ORF g.199427 m.199427 type:complete len:71 (-) comp14943_c0_seq1:2162-2374(-)